MMTIITHNHMFTRSVLSIHRSLVMGDMISIAQGVIITLYNIIIAVECGECQVGGFC